MHGFDDAAEGRIVVFDDIARVFSASLDRLEFLLLDEAAVGAVYIPIIKKARRRFPAVDIMVVGGPKADDVRAAERRQGVDYYYERPVEGDLLKAALQHRLDLARMKAGVGLVGRSPVLEEILEAILQVAPTDVPILIEGESGTGKDIIARAVHETSRRSEKPYVAINVASLAEGVLESELFGHEKGAFTGAVAQRAGVFERASAGTIFLDEVGEMSPNMQVRLLRVLESGEVLRVGGVKTLRVDVRVIAATNRNLSSAVSNGTFRQDLYYRLKGVSLYLPPLRNRKEDIPLLVDYFIGEANQKHGKSVKGIEADALRQLVESPWPGNIRELRNVVDTCVVLSNERRITGQLVASQLEGAEPDMQQSRLPVPLHRSKGEAEREMIYASILALHRDVREIMAMLRGAMHGAPIDGMKEVYPDGPGHASRVQTLSQLERTAIVDALRQSNGNRRKGSEILGISERTLYRKIKEYGLV